MEQLKPALTYDQQIEKLKTVHNLLIKDDNTAFEVKLEELIEKYKDVVILSYIGFPEEWKSVLSD
ncbi:MAG: hypothetical protein IKH41_01750 [Clostridia bacterium]|nr:hypothetical protein [Clostridia bacterium]